MKTTLFKTVDILILLIAIIILYFSISFWIGSYEDYNSIKNESPLSLFVNRFFINLIVIVFFLLMSFIINTVLFKTKSNKASIKKTILIETVILVLVSVLMIVFKEMI